MCIIFKLFGFVCDIPMVGTFMLKLLELFLVIFKCTRMELFANIAVCYFIKLSFYILMSCVKVLGFIQSFLSIVFVCILKIFNISDSCV